MSIQLINWSGHKNLGDDAMAEILLKYFDGSINVGEHPTEADWYMLGGGTLISPGSVFYGLVKYPERTIGISLGVSCNWSGEGIETLKKMKKIYTRDFFSHEKLKEFGIENTLSVDLLCYLKPTGQKERKEIWANLMYSHCNTYPELEYKINTTKECLEGKDAHYFALSPDEDIKTIPHAEVFTNAQELLDRLCEAKTIYATRLHAHVLAWLAECDDIQSLPYDLKIQHFFDRVKNLQPKEAREIINKHLEEIKKIF